MPEIATMPLPVPAVPGRAATPSAGLAPTPELAPLDALAEELAGELAAAWQQGRRPLSEEFLARHPALRTHRDAFLRLVCEELCARREAGQEPTREELPGRFPEWASELGA